MTRKSKIPRSKRFSKKKKGKSQNLFFGDRRAPVRNYKCPQYFEKPIYPENVLDECSKLEGIELEEQLGAGTFGVVFKGTAFFDKTIKKRIKGKQS